MAESIAAVVTQFNQPLEIQRLPFPTLEGGAMLVRVDAATLCGTDVHIWHNQMPGLADKIPFIPGHETSGTIVEMSGPRTDVLREPLKEGDRIIWTYPFCGHCYYCTVVRQPTLCSEGVRYGRARSDRAPYLLGGCAEHHYVPPVCDVIRIPENVSPALAASAACALRTIMHGFERLGTVGSHESILVQGAGPVGLYAAAVARDKGAQCVLVVGAPEGRLQVARDWGADATLNLDEVPDAAQRRQWVLEHTQGRGPDIVIQAAGAGAIAEGLDLVRPGGRFLSIGAGGGSIAVPAAVLSTKYLQIIGVLAAEGRHYYQAIQFLATRSLPFERVLSGTYPLNRVTEALQAMAEFREVKPVILPRVENSST